MNTKKIEALGASILSMLITMDYSADGAQADQA